MKRGGKRGETCNSGDLESVFWGDEKIMKYVSMAFYICGCFYVLFGIYAMLSNIKGRVNRQFSRLAISLAIWSYAYFISISVPTAEASAFWRSVTVFGWGVFPSLLVHLVLLIAEHKNLLKKRSTFIAIYLPAFINIILFSPFGYLEDASYKLVRTSFSWVNVFGNSIGEFGPAYTTFYLQRWRLYCLFAGGQELSPAPF